MERVFAGTQGDMPVWQRSRLCWERRRLLQGQMWNKFFVAVKLSNLAGGKGISETGGSKAYIGPWRWGTAGLCWRRLLGQGGLRSAPSCMGGHVESGKACISSALPTVRSILG